MNFRRLTITTAFMVFALYAGLLLSLFYFWESGRVVESLLSERTFFSIKLSLVAATVASLLSLFLAIPAAYALSRFTFPGRILIDTILELPMIVSPAALGAMLLIFFNNPLGVWAQEQHVQFVFTVYGIILAQFVTTLGVCTRLVKAALDEIPSRTEDVARSLGASPLRAFCTITLPLSRKGIFAAAALTWAKALGEFGATITIGGSMAFRTETLPVAIFMKLSTADIEGTVALILLLTSVGLALLFAVRLFSQERNV
jgi:molybdate transport system permease protein